VDPVRLPTDDETMKHRCLHAAASISRRRDQPKRKHFIVPVLSGDR
jgi:hypothetical protein